MNDLRKAAEMALEALDAYSWEQVDAATKALRKALAQPVDAVNMSQDRVDETVKSKHEPIGYIDGMHGGYMVFTPINPAAVYLNGTALYLAPPKKEWVGLTDDEIVDLIFSVDSYKGLVQATEAKLKEKNT